MSRAAAAVLSILTAANGITARAAESTGPPEENLCQVTIPFSVHDSKGWIPEGTIFTVKIEAKNNAPLPEETFKEIDVSGECEFGPIVFDEPDDYEYIISEIVYDDENIVFDRTIYYVHAAVLYNDSGQLTCGFALTKDESGSKPAEVKFVNDYLSPPDDSSRISDSSEPDDSGGDSDGGSGPPDSGGDSSGGGSDSSPDDTSSQDESSPGDSSADSSERPGGGGIPVTGGAVTIGCSGAVMAGLALMSIVRKRKEDDEDPPDPGKG